MFDADPPLPARRGAGRAGTGPVPVVLVLGVLVALAGLGWWLARDGGPAPLEALSTPGSGSSTSVPASLSTPATALDPDGEPADVERCDPPQAQPAATGCRITTSLSDPPIPSDPLDTSSPRELPDAPSFSPPLAYGPPALLDAADPTVLVDGMTYFLFTSAAHLLRVPVVAVPAADLVAAGADAPGLVIAGDHPGPYGNPLQTEAMPEAPPWVAPDRGVAAPTVERLGAAYVMFFSANRPDAPDPANPECVGRAVAVRPEGPYVADPEPFTCGIDETHGAFDPDLYRDPRDGRVYLHLTFGGTSTPLWTVPLTRDGAAAGPPTALLRMHQRWERWFLQSPAMFHDGRDFVLTYSAGDPRTAQLSTGVARCSSPTGPCASSSAGPWLESVGPVTGPGGLDVFADADGGLVVTHHAFVAGEEPRSRHTYLRRLVAEGGLMELG